MDLAAQIRVVKYGLNLVEKRIAALEKDALHHWHPDIDKTVEASVISFRRVNARLHDLEKEILQLRRELAALR